MMTSNKFMIWLKLSISLFCIILIIIGFGFGYIYNNYKNEACIENPLSYGIEKFNDINDDDFTCACTTMSGLVNPFYFNEDGVFRGKFSDSQVTIIPLK